MFKNIFRTDHCKCLDTEQLESTISSTIPIVLKKAVVDGQLEMVSKYYQ